MKEKLTFNETLLVGVLMFGLFFGAGNLIFPVMLGHEAGSNLWPATIGFLITAATLPALGIVAAALSRNEDMYDLASPVCKSFAMFYSVALFIAIGPAFAIPRNATVSFEIGIRPFIGTMDPQLVLGIFSFLFFAGVLVLSLRPAQIVNYVGKYLTPLFLVFLAVLLLAVIFNPVGGYDTFAAQGSYTSGALTAGLFDGYNTMDLLASVVFCIIIIRAVRQMGITEPKRIAVETAKAGVICVLAMAVIYATLTYMGGVSNNLLAKADNGGQIFAFMSGHYFGVYGQALIAVIVTLACFKTSIGIVTAGAEFFNNLFPKISVKAFIWGITVISFLVANVGLNAIISGAIPFLFFLYPLTIVLIVLALLYPFIGKSRPVYGITVLLTVLAAMFDLVKYSPEAISGAAWAQSFVGFATQYLPLYSMGLGWVIPALVGLVIGLGLHMAKGNK